MGKVDSTRRSRYISFHPLQEKVCHQPVPDESQQPGSAQQRLGVRKCWQQAVVDFGWLGVLNVDSNITLAAAVDLAAGSGHVNAVRHIP